jgi:hypothetical protein
MSSSDGRPACRRGWHDDPDNSGLCIHCAIILDADPDEDPNDFRRSRGWSDMPLEPVPKGKVQP